MSRTKRLIWTIAFLTLTGLPIGMECYAGFSHDKNTIPWTEYISHYIPWPIAALAYAVLAIWLPFHFIKHYRKHVTQRVFLNLLDMGAIDEKTLKKVQNAWNTVPPTAD